MTRTLRHDFPMHLVLAGLAVLTFYPFLFMVITSFKTSPQFIHDFWGVAWPPTVANYRDAWSRISVYLLNSIIVSGVSMLGVLLLASISGFVFARYNFPG